MKYLDRTNTTVEKTSGGFLCVTVDKERYEDVKLVRTFPFTDPDRYISVRINDEDAEEIGMILSQEDFDGQAKA